MMSDIEFIRQYVIPTGIAISLLMAALYIDRRVISSLDKETKWWFYAGLFILNCLIYVAGRLIDNAFHGEVYPLIKELIEVSIAICALFGIRITKYYKDKKKDDKRRFWGWIYFWFSFIYRAAIAISPVFLRSVKF